MATVNPDNVYVTNQTTNSYESSVTTDYVNILQIEDNYVGTQTNDWLGSAGGALMKYLGSV